MKTTSDSQDSQPNPRSVIGRDPQTGLPVIECERAATAVAAELDAARIAEILLEQEVNWHFDSVAHLLRGSSPVSQAGSKSQSS